MKAGGRRSVLGVLLVVLSMEIQASSEKQPEMGREEV